jgi:type I restriction enzyme M protein
MGSPFEKKYTQLTTEDIGKVAITYHNWQQVGFEKSYENTPEYCFSASIEDVKQKDFSLVPSKYIEFVNRDENIDFDEKMSALQADFAGLLKEEAKSKQDLLKVFKELGYEIKL